MTTAVTAVLIYVPVQYDLNVYTFLPDIRAQAVEGAPARDESCNKDMYLFVLDRF